jgi:hypothetical protein
MLRMRSKYLTTRHYIPILIVRSHILYNVEMGVHHKVITSIFRSNIMKATLCEISIVIRSFFRQLQVSAFVPPMPLSILVLLK